MHTNEAAQSTSASYCYGNAPRHPPPRAAVDKQECPPPICHLVNTVHCDVNQNPPQPCQRRGEGKEARSPRAPGRHPPAQFRIRRGRSTQRGQEWRFQLEIRLSR